MVEDLASQEGQLFSKGHAIVWFGERYPKIKEGTISAHLIRFSTNSPSRLHYAAKSDEDLLFQVDGSHFRLYDPATDPVPIHPKSDTVAEPSPAQAPSDRVAESHPRVKAYVKHHNLRFEVPYRYASETRTYIPDFTVLVDDGKDDPLHLIKKKKATLSTYWVPGVNHHGRYGRWVFAKFTDVYTMQSDFEARVEAAFNEMIKKAAAGGNV